MRKFAYFPIIQRFLLNNIHPKNKFFLLFFNFSLEMSFKQLFLWLNKYLNTRIDIIFEIIEIQLISLFIRLKSSKYEIKKINFSSVIGCFGTLDSGSGDKN